MVDEQSDLVAAAEDPNNPYESDIDESGIGTGRSATPPDGLDQDWSELHPNFAKELKENEAT